MQLDGVVLAGGSARRLHGADKALIEVGGVTLLERVVAALAGAGRIVVVGPKRDFDLPVLWIQEEPPGSGPVPALAAGLSLATTPLVAVVAVDMPFVSSEVIVRLAHEVQGRDGAVVRDGSGRDQMLLAVYRTDSLHRRLAALPDHAGTSMRDLIEGLDVQRVGDDISSFDCDTPEDVAAARGKVGELSAG
jgi:molybdopterin-guanine dinucleotide biosynthesis protein A